MGLAAVNEAPQLRRQIPFKKIWAGSGSHRLTFQNGAEKRHQITGDL